MKRSFIIILSIFLVNTSVSSVTYNSEPKIFITELVNDATKILTDKTIDKESKSKQIEKPWVYGELFIKTHFCLRKSSYTCNSARLCL